MSVFMLATHVYYALYVVDAPLYGGPFRFDYEVVNGHAGAQLTPPQLEANITLPRGGSVGFSRFANYTVPPPRLLYVGDTGRDVPYVVTTRVHFATEAPTQLEYDVLVDGKQVGNGTGQGDYLLPPNVRLGFADFDKMEVRARNPGDP